MMKGYMNLSVRLKILSVFAGVLIFIIALGVMAYSSLDNMVSKQIPLVIENELLSEHMLELRKHEKDFLIREVSNLEFFETGESKYLIKFDSEFEVLIGSINTIKSHDDIKDNPESIDKLNQIENYANGYQADFLAVVDKTKEKGFKNFGLVGELRNAVHDVEVALENESNIDMLTITMLQARRAEKDYFLRKDTAYQEKLHGIIATFKQQINNTTLSTNKKSALTNLMTSYQESFDSVVKADETIGFDSSLGLMGSYREQIHQLEPLIADLHVEIIDITNAKADQTKFGILAIVGVVLLISLSAGIFLAKIITTPINKMKNAAEKLALGDTGVLIEVNTKDEIGALGQSFVKMIENIKEQATALGYLTDGNLGFQLEPKSENDTVVKNLNAVKQHILKFNEQAVDMAHEIESGRLMAQLDSGLFKGCWKDILENVNLIASTLESNLQNAPTTIMTIDSNYNVLYMNKAGLSNLQTSQDQIKDMKCYELFNSDICGTERCACNRAMNQQTQISSEGQSELKKGSYDFVFESAPIQNETGQVLGAIEFIVDQTSIKNAARIQEKQSYYQEAEVEKLIENLHELANGKLRVSDAVAEPDKDTELIYRNFKNIYSSLNDMVDSIRSYISESSEVLTNMANQNMDVGIVREYKGDFVDMKASINHIVESFNAMLHDITESSVQVAAGASQVSETSQSLSQGTTEQSSSIEQITSSINQVAAQTKTNASNASKVNHLSGSISKKAQEGNAQMKNMLGAMNDINESSANISSIIKVIDEIAFQTNILALNAAVEAARAGQHGKGFAVVAEEVRNLAARSAGAAKQTTEMIEDSIQKVQMGTSIAKDTSTALDSIVKGIHETGELIEQIADASNDQAEALSEINVGINQVTEVTQHSAAISEESAASSEEMSAQAEVLRDLVSGFNLKRAKSPSSVVGQYNNTSTKAEVTPQMPMNLNNQDINISLDEMEFGKY